MVVSPTSESCGIAFKEWASVCDALLDGRQTIILRKGGISEGTAPGVFVPEHAAFWLYPTWVHQAEQGVRTSADIGSDAHSATDGNSIPIQAFVCVQGLDYVEREDILFALEDHHILTVETVSKRFHYRKPGLWVLGARVWRREPAHSVLATPAQAGCKTWVMLEEALDTSGLSPVFDDHEWEERRKAVRAKLGSSI